MARRGVENDALIESSFRRLLAAIESERDRIRSTFQQIEHERDSTVAELDRLRRDTEDWCFAEKQKIDAEWRRLDSLAEGMSGLWPQESQPSQLIQINCSETFYTIPRSTLCSMEGSHLSKMFGDDFIREVPRDSEGRYFLDFHPQCFALIIEYLQNKRLRADVPIPIVPRELQTSMDLLAEALKLKPFLRENRIFRGHGTSLSVRGNIVSASHPGWQVISAEHPLPASRPAYFEVQIQANPDVRGGLAVGLCGRVPQGTDVHTIRLSNAVLYNSNNGLVGDCIGSENVAKGIQLIEGSSLGIRHDPSTHVLTWYHNRCSIGTVQFKEESLKTMKSLYPIIGLYVPEQQVQVDFHAAMPAQQKSAPASSSK